MAKKQRVPQVGSTRSASDKKLMARVSEWIEAQYEAWTVRRSEQLRDDLGRVSATELSWAAFARHIGMGASALSHYRHALRVPSADAALKLARLDRGILDILGIEEDDLIIAAVVERWGTLSSEARRRIRDIAGIQSPVPGGEEPNSQGGYDDGEVASGRIARSARTR